MKREIDIVLSTEQTKAIELLEDNITKRVVFGGAAGGGKSFLACYNQIKKRTMYPGTRGYIARETLKDLKGSILVTFFDLIHFMGLNVKYNDQKSYIDFPNGSRISLLEVKYKPSDPNFNELGSTEYTDGVIEEGIRIHEKAAEILLTRTRYKHHEFGLSPKQLITCNPGPGWIRDKIVIPQIEQGPGEKNIYVPALLTSNPNKGFVEQYYQTLRDLSDEYDKARLLHGDWYATPKTGAEFYKYFDSDKHTRKHTGSEYNPELPLHVSFDENVNPYMACSVWQINGKRAIKIDEIALKHPRNTLKDTCREFERRYMTHAAGLFIYGDATSVKQDVKLEKGYNFFKLARTYLERYRPVLRVPKSNPPVVMRGNFINSVFDNNFDGIEIIYCDNCVLSIQDVANVLEDADGRKKKEKIKDGISGVTYEKYGHFSDSDDYFLCEAFRDSYRKYTKGGHEIDRTIVTRPRTNKLY